MKELVILDLDGVIIKGQSQKHLLDYLKRKKIISLFFYTKICILFTFYKLKLIKDPEKIMKQAYIFLKGKNVGYVEKTINDFFDNYLRGFLYLDMIDIINKHKSADKELIILSNSADFIVKKVANYLNIKYYIATNFEIINDLFTGNIDGDIIYGKNKINAIKRFINEMGLTFKNSYAYADHISDRGLLEIVEQPFAINPDKLLFKEAFKKNWKVINFRK